MATADAAGWPENFDQLPALVAGGIVLSFGIHVANGTVTASPVVATKMLVGAAVIGLNAFESFRDTIPWLFVETLGIGLFAALNGLHGGLWVVTATGVMIGLGGLVYCGPQLIVPEIWTKLDRRLDSQLDDPPQ